jgi:hypothetical protein
MNVNKNISSISVTGLVSLIVSVAFAIAWFFMVVTGITSVTTKDSSGLSNFVGQAALFLSLIPLSLAIIAFIIFKRSRRHQTDVNLQASSNTNFGQNVVAGDDANKIPDQGGLPHR